MPDDGARDDDDPVPGQSQCVGELEALGEQGHVGRGASDSLPGPAGDERAGGAHGEHVAAVVVLTLVDLTGDDVVGPARRAGGPQPDLEEQVGVVPIDLLGACQRDRAGGGDGLEELGQAVGLRGGVVVEEPEPSGVGGIEVEAEDRAALVLVAGLRARPGRGSLLGEGEARATAPPRVGAAGARRMRTAVTRSRPEASTASSTGVPSPRPLAREATSTTSTAAGRAVCAASAASVRGRKAVTPAVTTTARVSSWARPTPAPGAVSALEGASRPGQVIRPGA
ncbi:hypothetical protein ADENT20671_0743 [Actinomyces denticolens]|nr:hypothetical protein ADENT20671_0743 [Actinomyces denticolens]